MIPSLWTPQETPTIHWGTKEKAGTYLTAANALTKAGVGG